MNALHQSVEDVDAQEVHDKECMCGICKPFWHVNVGVKHPEDEHEMALLKMEAAIIRRTS